MKSITELIKDDPSISKEFKKVMPSEELDYKELLIELKLKVYEDWLKKITLEELDFEFSERITNEHYDYETMIEMLIDHASNILFDDPIYNFVEF